MIGYHQPVLSTNRTLYDHACELDSVRIMPVKLDRMHQDKTRQDNFILPG